MKGFANLTKIGHGEHGVVLHDKRTNEAVKIIPFILHSIGDASHAGRSENVECTIHELLSGFPHVLKYKESEIVEWVYDPYAKYKSVRSKILRTEFVAGGTLLEFIRQKKVEENATVYFKTILFQVAFALQTIYDEYPYFRHNDLTLSNIFVQKKNTLPVVWRNKVFNVQNFKFSLLIGDFGLASILGLIDNYETIECRAKYPTYTLGYKKDHRCDIFQFASRLYYCFKDKLDTKLKDKLDKCFNGCLNKGTVKNCFYAPPSIVEKLPTVAEILLFPGLFLYETVGADETQIIKDEFTGLFEFPDCDAYATVITKDLVKHFINASDDFISEVTERVNGFLTKHKRVPLKYTEAITVNVIIDVYRENTTKCKGETLLTLRGWVRLFKNKISLKEMMKICVWWSKVSENV